MVANWAKHRNLLLDIESLTRTSGSDHWVLVMIINGIVFPLRRKWHLPIREPGTGAKINLDQSTMKKDKRHTLSLKSSLGESLEEAEAGRGYRCGNPEIVIEL